MMLALSPAITWRNLNMPMPTKFTSKRQELVIVALAAGAAEGQQPNWPACITAR